MKTAWKVIVGILAVLLVLLLIAEGGIRMFMANQITSEYSAGAESAAESGEAAEPAEPKVSFGPQPVIFGLASGKLPHIEIETPSTLVVNGDEIYGEPASHVLMDNMRYGSGEPIADSLRLDTELTNDLIRAILNQQLREQMGEDSFLSGIITVSDVNTDPEAGTIHIAFSGGAASLDLKPITEAGQMRFEATGTKLFGFDLPDEVAGSLSDAMQQGMEDQGAGQLRIEDFTVVPGGVRVTMAGENVNFNDLQQMQGQNFGA
ncbi:DUF2993 domain-containing protein [Corynebacterium sp. HMSC071B10]|uniref:LmeA family phospholipid-binding protein n=1 Tax=Corynebacterium sp. HMSC071B10 TaxID=1739494 RepID=UPI0008A639E1|nr:DUF2993 domain-containing protein [Corynebacterium sp. HMSC071B10]OFP34317.1 hypothetical protein HMPREF2990_10260 [Corynebacterium sp. HMSC071B10]